MYIPIYGYYLGYRGSLQYGYVFVFFTKDVLQNCSFSAPQQTHPGISYWSATPPPPPIPPTTEWMTTIKVPVSSSSPPPPPNNNYPPPTTLHTPPHTHPSSAPGP